MAGEATVTDVMKWRVCSRIYRMSSVKALTAQKINTLVQFSLSDNIPSMSHFHGTSRIRLDKQWAPFLASWFKPRSYKKNKNKTKQYNSESWQFLKLSRNAINGICVHQLFSLPSSVFFMLRVCITHYNYKPRRSRREMAVVDVGRTKSRNVISESGFTSSLWLG